MSGVFYNGQLMFAGDLKYRLHITGMAVEMDRQDRFDAPSQNCPMF